ncbi:MAG: hypothetical protein DRH15_05190, partial [Deltaproteobacteria bacterium]
MLEKDMWNTGTFMLILSIVNLAFIAGIGIFIYESVHEQEPRAPKIGGLLLAFHTVLGLVILAWPAARIPIAWLLGTVLGVQTIFLIPWTRGARSLKGAAGYLAGSPSDFVKMDERDAMFARNRSILPGTPQYEEYYRMRPEHKDYDDRRRTKGGPLGKPGTIDSCYRPNVAMLVSSFELPNLLGKA